MKEQQDEEEKKIKEEEEKRKTEEGGCLCVPFVIFSVVNVISHFKSVRDLFK